MGTNYEYATNNKHWYNDKEYQPNMGQYDYGFRMYNATTARWNGADPLAAREGAAQSPYQYARNNPVNNIDVMGLYSYGAGGYGGGGYSGYAAGGYYGGGYGSQYAGTSYGYYAGGGGYYGGGYNYQGTSYGNYVGNGGGYNFEAPSNEAWVGSSYQSSDGDHTITVGGPVVVGGGKQYAVSQSGPYTGSGQGYYSQTSDDAQYNISNIDISGHIADFAGGVSDWAGEVNWTGVGTSTLGLVGGISEMLIGGVTEYFSAGASSGVSIPLIADGAVRTGSNITKLGAYLSLNDETGQATPGNIGAWAGKGVDMVRGQSFYDYGKGQAVGGAVNDVTSFVVTGGSAVNLQRAVTNPTLGTYFGYFNATAGYTGSLYFGLSPIYNNKQ